MIALHANVKLIMKQCFIWFRPKKKNPNTRIILLFTLVGLLHVATNYHSNMLPVFILITFTEITYPMKEISGM